MLVAQATGSILLHDLPADVMLDAIEDVLQPMEQHVLGEVGAVLEYQTMKSSLRLKQKRYLL